MRVNLRKFARGKRCQLRTPFCNHDPETTVLCHLRMAGVAGTGQKPPDLIGIHACSRCHDVLDGRIDPYGDVWKDRDRDTLFALIRTLNVVSKEIG